MDNFTLPINHNSVRHAYLRPMQNIGEYFVIKLKTNRKTLIVDEIALYVSSHVL